MTKLYPPIQPNRELFLQVDDIHKIYLEESGNVDGTPVVYLHGGPGAGSNPFMRQLFDPEKYRIILFDQRGCGKSRPNAELRQNTINDLIADIETIREELGIQRWVVAGGSWGSTLSLAYAQKHPARVLGLIVRGIFLGEQDEINWLYQGGAGQIFPEFWEKFRDEIPKDEQHEMLNAYHRRLSSDNEFQRMKAARAWALWESRISTLLPKQSSVSSISEPQAALAISRIEAHYFVNDSFLAEGQLLADTDKLANIPGTIVHGRYDMICLAHKAWALHKKWPLSEMQFVQAAGHSASESGITAALVEAGNSMLRRIADNKN